MLKSPKVNVSNIMRVIESIKSDPEFNMNRWESCISGHCHKVQGSVRYDQYMSSYDFLGVEPLYANGLFAAADGKGKEEAIASLYALLDFDGVPSTVD